MDDPEIEDPHGGWRHACHMPGAEGVRRVPLNEPCHVCGEKPPGGALKRLEVLAHEALRLNETEKVDLRLLLNVCERARLYVELNPQIKDDLAMGGLRKALAAMRRRK